jgi:hypothetical protein
MTQQSTGKFAGMPAHVLIDEWLVPQLQLPRLVFIPWKT